MRLFDLPGLLEQEFPELEFLLAFLSYNGYGVPQDRDIAFTYFLAAAEKGLPTAQYFVARMLHKNDPKVAAEWYEKAANKGHRLAAQGLAYIYENEIAGDATDYSRTVHWLERAAELGCETSAFRLAELYEAGQGVSRSEERALSWYKKAAELGSDAACDMLASIYGDGRLGASVDAEEAHRYERLGKSLADRRVSRQSEWLLKGAMNGDRVCQEMLASGYANGWYGLGVDPARSDYWQRISSSRLIEPPG